MENDALRQLGNVPVTSAALESLYPELKRGNQKLRLLERDGLLIRLKKGLYVCSYELTGKPISRELIANHLYAPSYVSMSAALGYYDLIPEAVFNIQSMTLKHTRRFETPCGHYLYQQVPPEVFPIGLTNVRVDGNSVLMASPEKALCDLVAYSLMVNLRYVKQAAVFLEEDIRLELDDFMQMDASVFERYAEVGKKAGSIRTLAKLLRSLRRS